MNEISKEITNTYPYLVKAKFRNFTRRSLPRHAFASVILTVGILLIASSPITLLYALQILFLIFGSLIVLSVAAIYISASRQARQLASATITFRMNEIELHASSNAKGQTFGYDWIGEVLQEEKGLVFKRATYPPFYIFLDHASLSHQEHQQLEEWLTVAGKTIT